MTRKEFLNRVAESKRDVLGELASLLERRAVRYCVIGGLAVNAYADPVVSLDLDIVVAEDRVPQLLEDLAPRFKVKRFPNSLNLTSSETELRIQIQTDPRYQGFLAGARKKDVLGYRLPVARAEDVMRGKIWAAEDPKRRPSKRQKDLSDILRLIEARSALAGLVPAGLKSKLGL